MSFRQRTYHADYFEPRVSSRRELLDASYRSAVAQCQKAGIATRNQIFILEDTSVRIEALSSGAQEVPGLDIKYWMHGMTFESVDQFLKLEGNDRRATVRSDVLLHVPLGHRQSWGTEQEYLVFEGEQEGSVVEGELVYETNLVYPWLDNETFNKWFVPIGAKAPLGSLGIEEANKYDFRRESFGKLFGFLERVGALELDPVQAMLSLDQAPNYILCGYTCAGKTVASQHLAQQFGYEHIEASDFMYLSYYYRHGYQSEVSIGDFAEQALEQKPEIAAERVVQYVEENLFLPIVISGFRAWAEVEWLRRSLSYSGKRFQVIFVEAERSERFRRLGARGRIGDDISFSRFLERDGQQQRMGLEEVRSGVDTTEWMNGGTLEAYFGIVEADIDRPVIARMNFDEARRRVAELEEVRLEESILVSLLSVWSDEGERGYYTTSEIAGIVNRVFSRIQPKHKDNVSRYFNQDFYPYYDIASDGETGVRKYRLSNTGFGRALLAINELIGIRVGMTPAGGGGSESTRGIGKGEGDGGMRVQLELDLG